MTSEPKEYPHTLTNLLGKIRTTNSAKILPVI